MLLTNTKGCQSFSILDSLRLPHGLYLASPSSDYSYVWLRDSFYMSLPYLSKTCDTYERTYWRFLDLFLEYEWKLDIHSKQKPKFDHERIHARYSAQDVREINTPWGHAQNDAIGAILWGIGEGLKRGKNILRDDHDRLIVQKLVWYLETLEYWNDEDSGMWEEIREQRSSSITACVAGLRNVRDIVSVKTELIDYGMQALRDLFPKETPTREVDLAQLSMVYPYNIFEFEPNGREMSNLIISRVEKHLIRLLGVIRYEGDSYYSTLEDEHGRGRSRSFYLGTEAEWTFGLPWLSLCHHQLGRPFEAERYLAWTEKVMTPEGGLPELYYSRTYTYNVNTPLGWSNAMYILASEELA